MARLYNKGAETGDTSGINVEWTGEYAYGSGMTRETTITRGSRGAWKCTVGGAGQRYVYTPFLAADSTNDIYAKFDFYLDTDGYGPNQPEIFQLRNSINQSCCGVLYSGTPNTLSLADSAGTIVVTGPTITTGVWYTVEIGFIYNAAGSTAELRVDGISYGSATVGNPAAGNKAAGLLFGSTQSAASLSTSILVFDSIIINDSTGAAQNSWVGNQRLMQAHPVAMGDAVTDTDASPYLWQTAAGGLTTGDLTNWNRVDETPPDDDTTKSRAALTQHYLDIYAVETRATVGYMNATDTLAFLNVNGRVAGTGTTTRPFTYYLQYDSSGTGATSSGNLDANANAWFTGDVNNVVGAILHPVYPSGKVGSDLDTIEIGIDKNDGTSRVVQVSAVWLEFTYTVPYPRLHKLGLLGVGI